MFDPSPCLSSLICVSLLRLPVSFSLDYWTTTSIPTRAEDLRGPGRWTAPLAETREYGEADGCGGASEGSGSHDPIELVVFSNARRPFGFGT